VSSLIFGGDQSRLTSAATRRGSWSQCVRKREWGLSMNRTPSLHPSPPTGGEGAQRAG